MRVIKFTLILNILALPLYYKDFRVIIRCEIGQLFQKNVKNARILAFLQKTYVSLAKGGQKNKRRSSLKIIT